MKPEQQKNLLYILVPSTILIILWIAFSVYNRSVMNTINKSQSIAIQPISPVFPTGVIESLKKRKSFTPLYSIDSVPNLPASSEADLTPTPSPSPALDSNPATNAADLGGAQ